MAWWCAEKADACYVRHSSFEMVGRKFPVGGVGVAYHIEREHGIFRLVMGVHESVNIVVVRMVRGVVVCCIA